MIKNKNKDNRIKIPTTQQPIVVRTNRVTVVVTTPKGSFEVRLLDLQDVAYKLLSIDLPYTVKSEAGKLTLAHDAGSLNADPSKSPIFKFISSVLSI